MKSFGPSDEELQKQEYAALRDANKARLEALQRSGTPVQVNGLEQHLLMFFIQNALGDDALTAALLQWEEKMSGILDNVDSQIRMATLLAPANGKTP